MKHVTCEVGVVFSGLLCTPNGIIVENDNWNRNNVHDHRLQILGIGTNKIQITQSDH